jgi:hypothetical protein
MRCCWTGRPRAALHRHATALLGARPARDLAAAAVGVHAGWPACGHAPGYDAGLQRVVVVERSPRPARSAGRRDDRRPRAAAAPPAPARPPRAPLLRPPSGGPPANRDSLWLHQPPSYPQNTARLITPTKDTRSPPRPAPATPYPRPGRTRGTSRHPPSRSAAPPAARCTAAARAPRARGPGRAPARPQARGPAAQGRPAAAGVPPWTRGTSSSRSTATCSPSSSATRSATSTCSPCWRRITSSTRGRSLQRLSSTSSWCARRRRSAARPMRIRRAPPLALQRRAYASRPATSPSRAARAHSFCPPRRRRPSSCRRCTCSTRS